MMFSKLKLTTAIASLLLATLMTTGCHVQSSHPNQVNAFDGGAYDTMLLAHGALTALRTSISTDFPQYFWEFNRAADTYNAAVVIYSAYRSSSEVEPSVSAALGNLAVSITVLEGALVSDLQIDAQHSAQVRKAAGRIRGRVNAHMTIADVLAELEIAASLAAVVPATEGYATLAKVIIDATGAALAAEQAEANKPIQLDAIAAIIPIQQ